MRTSITLGLMLLLTGPAAAAEAPAIESQDWSFGGIFGTYDRAELQRGLQVYKGVCAACHGLRQVAFRNLADLGYKEDQIKAFSAEYEVRNKEPNEEGEMFNRKGRPADRFPSPFANEQAARAANNGAMPPDLSVITKAREGGADYIYALLTGYKAQPPKGMTMPEGMSYNAAYPGHQIAMAAPLTDEAVEYQDGTKPTVAQMARDVTAFLTWAAEPEMESRKRMGIKVLLFLIVFTAVLIAVKQQVWKNVH